MRDKTVLTDAASRIPHRASRTAKPPSRITDPASRIGPGGRRPGKVWLIGAGPGDPELITLKAVRVLHNADVVLVDDLVDRRVLAHVRPDARVVDVGKRGGCRSTPQEFIERLMVRLARSGAAVARLKGGDPFIFGRGGEEVAVLGDAGIPVEVISGITAGTAVPAALGIPVTHRGLARGAVLVSGHCAGQDEPDWDALARCGLTLVIYMGMARLAQIAARLQAGGLAGGTPAALIQNGTLPGERSVITTLAGLCDAARGFGAPAIIVIGETVRLARSARAQPARRVA